MWLLVTGFLGRYGKILAIVAGVIALSVTIYQIYDAGYDRGHDVCELDHIKKQNENDANVKKTFRKVDNEVPVTADRDTRSKWMRSIGRTEDSEQP